MAYYGYPSAPHPPSPRPRWKLWAALGYLGFLMALMAAAMIYQMMERLDTQILTVIATVACAGGMALPGITLALVVLLRVRDNQRNQPNAQAMLYPPQVVVIPPMAYSPPALGPGNPPPIQMETVPARRFTVVGEE